MPRKNVWVEVDSLSYYELDGTKVKGLAERLLEMERQHPGARMVEGQYAYETTTYLSIQAERPETDAEMQKREVLEERAAAEEAARKRRQFEALKKELGE